jgi:hypothetical protein
MKPRLRTPDHPSGDHILVGMLAASLTLVGTIAAASQAPEAIGVAVALTMLLAMTGAIGVFIRRLLSDPEPD